MRHLFRVLLVVSALGLLPSDAAAVPILWTLNATVNGQLGGSGLLTGSFVYDADTNLYSNVDVNSTLPDADFDTSDVGVFSGATNLRLITNFGLPDLNGQPTVAVSFNPVLSNAGGNVSVSGVTGICVGPNCSGTSVSGFGGVVSGSLTGTPLQVPEPTSLLLLGTGLAAAGWRRKQRRA